MITGGALHKFTEGWAVNVYVVARKAHYWKRGGAGVARTMCSSRQVVLGALREAGSYEHCKPCSDMFGRLKAPTTQQLRDELAQAARNTADDAHATYSARNYPL
jgi:hypothetical protein